MGTTELSTLGSLSTSLGALGLTNSLAARANGSSNLTTSLDASQQFSWSSSDISATWGKRFAGSDSTIATALATDNANNVYIAGSFSGTVDFDPGDGTFNLTSGGGSDSFIVKLDANGNFVWAKDFGGTGNDAISAIAVSSTGNVYTIGAFTGTVDFDPGAGTFNLSSAGTNSPFMTKLDTNGSFAWAKGIGSSAAIASGIAIDSSENVYVGGSFSGSVAFTPTASAFNLTSAGLNDGFIAKLTKDGNFTWTKRVGGAGDDSVASIAIDGAGSVYTTGTFSGTADFDPNTSVFNLTAAGSNNTFVSKLNSSGNFVWAKSFGSNGSSKGNEIAVDSTGNVYVGGGFAGTIDFDPGAGVSNLTSSAIASLDAFITKLDTTGNFVWAKSFGGAVQVTQLALDKANNLYATGSFSGTVDFDPGPGISNLTSAGDSSLFLAKLDANAANSSGFTWVKSIGGGTGSSTTAAGIAIDQGGNVYSTGSFKGTIDADPGPGVISLAGATSAASYSGFVTKFSAQETTGSGTLVSTILGAAATNPTTGAAQSLAMTTADITNGTWQYSVNGGASWLEFGTFSATNPLLLVADSNTRLRFVPKSGYRGTADIRFYVVETRSGSRPAPSIAR